MFYRDAIPLFIILINAAISLCLVDSVRVAHKNSWGMFFNQKVIQEHTD